MIMSLAVLHPHRPATAGASSKFAPDILSKVTRNMIVLNHCGLAASNGRRRCSDAYQAVAACQGRAVRHCEETLGVCTHRTLLLANQDGTSWHWPGRKT